MCWVCIRATALRPHNVFRGRTERRHKLFPDRLCKCRARSGSAVHLRPVPLCSIHVYMPLLVLVFYNYWTSVLLMMVPKASPSSWQTIWCELCLPLTSFVSPKVLLYLLCPRPSVLARSCLRSSAFQLRQYFSTHISNILPTRARNVAVANRVLSHQHLVSMLARLARGRRHTHVRHVSDNHDLLETRLLEHVVEVGLAERAGELLADDRLVLGVLLGLELGELGGEGCAGREDGGALGDLGLVKADRLGGGRKERRRGWGLR